MPFERNTQNTSSLPLPSERRLLSPHNFRSDISNYDNVSQNASDQEEDPMIKTGSQTPDFYSVKSNLTSNLPTVLENSREGLNLQADNLKNLKNVQNLTYSIRPECPDLRPNKMVGRSFRLSAEQRPNLQPRRSLPAMMNNKPFNPDIMDANYYNRIQQSVSRNSVKSSETENKQKKDGFCCGIWCFNFKGSGVEFYSDSVENFLLPF